MSLMTGNQAAGQIEKAFEAGRTAGATTPLTDSDYNPYADYTRWERTLNREWSAGCRRGRRERRGEIKAACHELTNEVKP